MRSEHYTRFSLYAATRRLLRHLIFAAKHAARARSSARGA